jgi:hypothetical protein
MPRNQDAGLTYPFAQASLLRRHFPLGSREIHPIARPRRWRPTQPTLGSKQRCLDGNKRRSDIKAKRGSTTEAENRGGLEHDPEK